MKKYYDVYFKVYGDNKTGYSVFVKAEEEEDLENIHALTALHR